MPLVDLLVADGEHGVQLPGGICLERPRSLRGQADLTRIFSPTMHIALWITLSMAARTVW
ncbi:hypothetical protein ABT150_26535 [Streptomyces mirabilis]|uniref:hypothetical protein n=1 Tax=Streptomyces mirabilis TaxID=68239 RepID=UPI00332D1830